MFIGGERGEERGVSGPYLLLLLDWYKGKKKKRVRNSSSLRGGEKGEGGEVIFEPLPG